MPLDATTQDRYYAKMDVQDENGRFVPHFVPSAGAPVLSDADHEFATRLRRAIFCANACSSTMEPHDRLRYLNRLREIGSAPRAECGLRQMESFEKDFEHELKKHRERYASRATAYWGAVLASALLLTALMFAVDFGLPRGAGLGAFLDGFEPGGGFFVKPFDISDTATWVFVWVWGAVGLAVGEMFTARYDSMDPKYETFFTDPRFRYMPVQRVAFVALTWTILIFLLAHDWFDLTVGGLSLGKVDEAPWSAVVLGITTSVGFQGLLSGVVERIRRKEK